MTTRAKASAGAAVATSVQSTWKLRESDSGKQVEIIDCYGVVKWAYKDEQTKKKRRGRKAEELSYEKEEKVETLLEVGNGSRVEEEQNRTHVRKGQNGFFVKEEREGSSADELTNGTIVKEEANGNHVNVATNGADESACISQKMIEEEKILQEQRMKDLAPSEETTDLQNAVLEDSMCKKLDKLLTKTQLYSAFLLEKMDRIASSEQEPDMPTRGRGRASGGRGKGVKRKAAAANSRASRKAITETCPVLPEGQEDIDVDGLGDEFLTEEERVLKEQKKIVPLLTGGTLKPFQMKGIKWMISLWQNGLNGILADQMGLGKTIQTIGLLAHLKGQGMHGPFLIIAPLSTLSNWVSEVKRWVPVLPVLLYHGSKDEREVLRSKLPDSGSPDFPVIVTSYEVAMFDIAYLVRRKWKYVVVDEGHRLKNFDCKLLRELKKVQVDNKLLLTGSSKM